MRARKKKHGAERLSACGEYMIHEGGVITNKPVILEIGCGKGKFITEFALNNPDKNIIGIEKTADIIVLAAEKVKNNKLINVKLINDDVVNLPKFFTENDVTAIYLNFSDPWPKSGHYKRRLTYKSFLDIYKSILIPRGQIFFKTDNLNLFEFSIDQLNKNGFKVQNATYDLHSSEYAKENITTEYETNFIEKGFKINRLEAIKL